MKHTVTGQEEQTSLYDSDFALWAPEADREHVAEEIGDMAKRPGSPPSGRLGVYGAFPYFATMPSRSCSQSVALIYALSWVGGRSFRVPLPRCHSEDAQCAGL